MKVHLTSDGVHLSLDAKKIYREALLKIVADLDKKIIVYYNLIGALFLRFFLPLAFPPVPQ